jgi:hypothetical protein
MSADPDDRPSASELARRLAALLRPEADAIGEWRPSIEPTLGPAGPSSDWKDASLNHRSRY